MKITQRHISKLGQSVLPDIQQLVQYNFKDNDIVMVDNYVESNKNIEHFRSINWKNNIVAIFRVRAKAACAALLFVLLFASCTKHNDVQFTTFSGQPAVNYTVVVEAQQANAASIWSPTSSIALPK